MLEFLVQEFMRLSANHRISSQTEKAVEQMRAGLQRFGCVTPRISTPQKPVSHQLWTEVGQREAERQTASRQESGLETMREEQFGQQIRGKMTGIEKLKEDARVSEK